MPRFKPRNFSADEVLSPIRRKNCQAVLNAENDMSANLKKIRFFKAFAASLLRPSVPLLRVIPTDFCNLNCVYCWQHRDDPFMMPESVFEDCLRHALKLDTGLLSFLGGEPTLWEPLPAAIAAC